MPIINGQVVASTAALDAKKKREETFSQYKQISPTSSTMVNIAPNVQAKMQGTALPPSTGLNQNFVQASPTSSTMVNIDPNVQAKMQGTPAPTMQLATDTIFQPTSEPKTIDEALGKTYEEQAQDQFYGQFKTMYDNAQKYGITLPFKTFEEYKTWKQSGNKQQEEYLNKQFEIERQVEASQIQKSFEQMAGAESGVTSSMAQSREGVMTTTKPQFAQEFAGQMERQKQQIELERRSAENRRQQAIEDLRRANESGDVDLAQAIAGQLASIENNIRQIETESLNAATRANEQAMKAFELQESNNRANLNMFMGMVNTGAQLTTEGIMGFAQSLNLPLEIAFDYYQGVESIRTDKTLDTQSKKIALAQAGQNLQDQIDRVNTTAASQTEYLKQLYSSGASQEMISAFKSAAGITDMNDPAYMANLRYNTAKAQLAEMEAMGAVPYGSMEYWKREQLKAEVEQQRIAMNEYKYGSTQGDVSNIDKSELAKIFTLTGVSKYGHGEGKRECGEAYNQLTDGKKVGDLYSTKMAAVTKRDNPQIGNGLAIPLAGAGKWGHMETVIGFNPTTGVVSTVSYNRDKKGGQTFESYTIDELNKKYGKNWGFTDSTLKSQFHQKFNSVIGTQGGPSQSSSVDYNRYVQTAKDKGIDEAIKLIQREYADTKERAEVLKQFDIITREQQIPMYSVAQIKGVFKYVSDDLATALAQMLYPVQKTQSLYESELKATEDSTASAFLQKFKTL